MVRTWGMKALPLTILLLLGGAAVGLANVPPPPANQTLGIFDGSFNNLTESQCRACHSAGLPDRHHLLVGLPIPVGTCRFQPTVLCQADIECQNSPTPGANPLDYCISDSQAPNAPPPPSGNYECLTCHTLVYNPSTFSYEFAPFRNCTLCHTSELRPGSTSPQEPTVHHRGSVPSIQDFECGDCHGSLVNNVFDGHYIPTYSPSLVTPWPAEKPNGGEPPNSRGTLAGNCNYCHDSTGVDGSGPILNNHDTHHGTGLTRLPLPAGGPWGGAQTSGCRLCHPGSGPAGDAFDIRICERCHGVQSVHNIQVDTNGNGISPGNELAYYGHIGDQDDCWGCHGFAAASLAPYSGPVVPNILDSDVSVLTAGNGATVTLSGVAFTNFVETPSGPIELQSNGLLTAPDGSETSLAAQSVTESEMVVNVPGTLTSGRHYLRAAKATQVSNPAVLAVKPGVTIASASCSNGTVTVTGSGFSSHVEAADSGTGVNAVIAGAPEKGTVVSWSDSQIVASFSECGEAVQVSSVFGSAAKSLNPAGACTSATVVGAGPESTSKSAGALYLMLLPFAAVMFWKIRRRRN